MSRRHEKISCRRFFLVMSPKIVGNRKRVETGSAPSLLLMNMEMLPKTVNKIAVRYFIFGQPFSWLEKCH